MWFSKKGITQEVLHQFKYKGQLSIGIQLSRAFVLRNETEWEQKFDCVVPVPMHPIKKWFRGYNQAEIIANIISKELNIPMYSNGLVKKHTFKVQAKLSKRQRELSIIKRFRMIEPSNYLGKNILIVDDVFTTGTTIYSCAELLKNAGAKSVVAATLVSVK
jgi:ComF family protein